MEYLLLFHLELCTNVMVFLKIFFIIYLDFYENRTKSYSEDLLSLTIEYEQGICSSVVKFLDCRTVTSQCNFTLCPGSRPFGLCQERNLY